MIISLCDMFSCPYFPCYGLASNYMHMWHYSPDENDENVMRYDKHIIFLKKIKQLTT